MEAIDENLPIALKNTLDHFFWKIVHVESVIYNEY